MKSQKNLLLRQNKSRKCSLLSSFFWSQMMYCGTFTGEAADWKQISSNDQNQHRVRPYSSQKHVI